MTDSELADFYRDYLACLNGQDWPSLAQFVAHDVVHNGRAFGLAGYRAMLEKDFEDIPDLRFAIEMMTCDPPSIAARLAFDCTPKGEFQGLPVNGRRVTFSESVFYELHDRKIAQVWSVVDKAGIEAQL
ncbi:MAG: ester cyclase [Pseudomonadota bacterium]|nr:ester cyclase [Pseudomonadota bacterium]